MQKKNHRSTISIAKSFLAKKYYLLFYLFAFSLFIFYNSPPLSFGQEAATPNLSPELSQAAPIPDNSAPPGTKQKPVGAVLKMSFAIPGIGSGGGTMTPKRTKRTVFLYLYASDVNSSDPNVKPIYTIKTTADFDNNKLNPTYTAFVIPAFDLGYTVKDGKYQIAFSTEQSLHKIVKEKESQVGGSIYRLDKEQITRLPLQKVIMGDVSPPEGNNVMDIADYNLLVACFGKTDCKYFKESDLNEDGVVDGIDYNIMARGFNQLVAMGIAPPVLPTPTSTQVSKLSELRQPVKKKQTAQPKVVEKKSESSPVIGIIVTIVVLLLLAGVGFFVLTKTSFGKTLLKKDKTPKPAAPPATADPAAPSPDASTDTAAPAAAPEAIAESTEIPIESLAAEKAAPATAAPAADAAATPEAIAESTEIPVASLPPADASAPAVAPAAAPADGSVDKTYYVKKKSADAKGTWFVLTDDAGPIDGLLTTGTIEDGFERIKGKIVEEKGKKYVLISEVLPSE